VESVESQQAHDFQLLTGKPSQHQAVRIITLLPLLISGPILSYHDISCYLTARDELNLVHGIGS
jgi:hypothetical protein